MKLNEICGRRNEIAHQSDRRHSDAIENVISKESVLD